MVRASHLRSEGYGFDSRQGLRNVFLREQLESVRIKKNNIVVTNIDPIMKIKKLVSQKACIN